MKKFEFVDITTADTAFIAYGRNPDEVFANAASAMFEVMVDIKKIKPIVSRNVKVKGNDFQSLLFNWLNELLVYVDSENLVFSEFDVEINEKRFELKARCRGEKINPEKHEVRTGVKSATYHKLEVKKEKNIWKAQVILDI